MSKEQAKVKDPGPRGSKCIAFRRTTMKCPTTVRRCANYMKRRG